MKICFLSYSIASCQLLQLMIVVHCGDSSKKSSTKWSCRRWHGIAERDLGIREYPIKPTNMDEAGICLVPIRWFLLPQGSGDPDDMAAILGKPATTSGQRNMVISTELLMDFEICEPSYHIAF